MATLVLYAAGALFWTGILAILYAYFGYPLLLAAVRPLLRGTATKCDDRHCPTVSIVLAAHNEAEHVAGKLENCLSLDYPADKLQILVGSDGSEDGTNAIVESFAGRGVRLLAFHPRRGKMAAVNRIVGQATGEICVFSDVAEVFDRDALLRLVRHFADPGVGAVTGNHIYNSQRCGLGAGTSFYWKFQRFLQEVETRIYSVCACDGTIYACRRELFPFPPDDTIDDDVAVPLGIIRQGKRVVFERKAVARGDVLKTPRRFFQQKVRSQAGRYQIFALFPDMFRPWPLRRWWIFMSHNVLPVLVPWFLGLVLIANVVLATAGSPVYIGLLALQAGFYAAALAGYLAEKLRFYIGAASIPFYFVTANVGSMCGFLAYITGRQRAAWKRVD